MQRHLHGFAQIDTIIVEMAEFSLPVMLNDVVSAPLKDRYEPVRLTSNNIAASSVSISKKDSGPRCLRYDSLQRSLKMIFHIPHSSPIKPAPPSRIPATT